MIKSKVVTKRIDLGVDSKLERDKLIETYIRKAAEFNGVVFGIEFVDGKAVPIDPTNQFDVVGAEGVNKWINDGEPVIPTQTSYVLNAALAAGITEHNGIPIQEALANEKEHEAEMQSKAEQVCRAAVALNRFMIGYAENELMDLATEAILEGQFGPAKIVAEAAVVINMVKDRHKKIEGLITDVPQLSFQLLHDLVSDHFKLSCTEREYQPSSNGRTES